MAVYGSLNDYSHAKPVQEDESTMPVPTHMALNKAVNDYLYGNQPKEQPENEPEPEATPEEEPKLRPTMADVWDELDEYERLTLAGFLRKDMGQMALMKISTVLKAAVYGPANYDYAGAASMAQQMTLQQQYQHYGTVIAPSSSGTFLSGNSTYTPPPSQVSNQTMPAGVYIAPGVSNLTLTNNVIGTPQLPTSLQDASWFVSLKSRLFGF